MMISPTLMVRLGLTLISPTVTRLFLMASTATERVLKMRAAHSHLSMRAEVPHLGNGLALVTLMDWFALFSGLVLSDMIDKWSKMNGRGVVAIFDGRNRSYYRLCLPMLLNWFIVALIPWRTKLLMILMDVSMVGRSVCISSSL